MAKTFTDQERAVIARAWAASGLPQDQYAARYRVTGRALRGWMAKFTPSQPPLERAEALLVEMMARLQTVLEGVRAERAELEFRAEGPRCISAPPPCIPTVDAERFRPERQPEGHRAEPNASARPAGPRRGTFFQEFRSE
jgi:hypothetical protein